LLLACSARYCAECNEWHATRSGDIWFYDKGTLFSKRVGGLGRSSVGGAAGGGAACRAQHDACDVYMPSLMLDCVAGFIGMRTGA
jgi:hypothetical protein